MIHDDPARQRDGAYFDAPEFRIRWWWIVGAALVLLVGWAISAGNTPEAKEKQRLRDAIDLCWQEQGRKSMTPGQGRFVAGACELLEREFVEKYRHRP